MKITICVLLKNLRVMSPVSGNKTKKRSEVHDEIRRICSGNAWHSSVLPFYFSEPSRPNWT